MKKVGWFSFVLFQEFQGKKSVVEILKVLKTTSHSFIEASLQSDLKNFERERERVN